MSKPHDSASTALVVITREASSCLSSLSLSPTRLHARSTDRSVAWHEGAMDMGVRAATTAWQQQLVGQTLRCLLCCTSDQRHEEAGMC